MNPTRTNRPRPPIAKRRRRQLLCSDGPFCYLCGHLIIKGRATLDHRIPKVRGGANHISNCGLTHAMCNQRKATKILPANHCPMNRYARRYKRLQRINLPAAA